LFCIIESNIGFYWLKAVCLSQLMGSPCVCCAMNLNEANDASEKAKETGDDKTIQFAVTSAALEGEKKFITLIELHECDWQHEAEIPNLPLKIFQPMRPKRLENP
jgi:hypothetical protein